MKTLKKLAGISMLLAMGTAFTQAEIKKTSKPKDRPTERVAGVTNPEACQAEEESLEKRVQSAEKIFVGIVTNLKILDNDWCHADLKVTRTIAAVTVDEIVPVQWRPKLASYDAKENQEGLAILRYKDGKRYWLRPDTFVDSKSAAAAVKFLRKKVK